MGILGIVCVGIGLAMDAFAVSICKGLSMKQLKMKNSMIIGAYFGIFQAIMPVIGFCLGIGFEEIVSSIDHWVAFILLLLIGLMMIKEAFHGEEEANDDLSLKTMFFLAIATSIDALAIGITFAFLGVNILLSAIMIGVITFILSIIGVMIGNRFGNKYEKKAKIFGGIILILIGIKTLLEHLLEM